MDNEFKHKVSLPIVTIGVCVRNCATTVGEAIESIMKQDYPHELIEVIFVDDGSTDKTLSMIKSHMSKLDMRVKVFHHEWKGIGYSRNIVFKNAGGKYIVWIDGDMIVPPNFIRKLVEFMETHPNVGIVKGKQSLNIGSCLLGTLEAYSRAASRMVNYQSEKSKFKSLGTGGAIYRVKALMQVGGFDDGMRCYYEDFDLELRMKAFGWALDTFDVEFYDYERGRVSLRGIWEKYWLRGYYAHYFLHKNPGAIKIYKMFPLIAVLAGFLDAVKLYPLTHRAIVFLLPILYFFKLFAWNIGFIKSHLETYAP